ncbi:MAG: response regulator [Thermomicrobiales bacterium]
MSDVLAATTAVPCAVLVVEDNPDSRESLLEFLRLSGLSANAAADGEEGVLLGLALRPRVAILDIGLPGIDGFEVATVLRRSLGGSVMLIAHTAFSGAEYRERANLVGFDHYLVKPCNPNELLAMLHTVC